MDCAEFAFRWPSLSAGLFLNDPTTSTTTAYPMTRRKSRVWREINVGKMKMESRSSSALSTPLPENDLEMEMFLEQMDFSSFEGQYEDEEEETNRNVAEKSQKHVVEERSSPVTPVTPFQASSLPPGEALDISSEQDEKRLDANQDAEEVKSSPISNVSQLSSASSSDESEAGDFVELEYTNAGAKSVMIAGSFSDWQQWSLEKSNDRWHMRLEVKPGVYSYKFVVDGNWICDESQEIICDEYGNRNNLLRVGSCRKMLEFKEFYVRETAFVAGDFSSWNKIELQVKDGKASADILMPYGRTAFKFFVDGGWYCSSHYEKSRDRHGNTNNAIIVGSQEKKFTWQGWNANTVCVAGSFNGWKKLKLEKDGDKWSCGVQLDYGEYEFKFVIDDVWLCDNRYPKRYDGSGNQNNFFKHGIVN